MSLLQDTRRGAVFDDDREYRYRLWRTWDVTKPTCCFIMLNPSTADETALDPTCRRCLNYAGEWGYGTLVIGNLFALRSTDPDHLKEHPDPVGPRNDDHLMAIVEDDPFVVCAWGTGGDLEDRGPEVASMLAEHVDLYALGTTKDGHPVHPLYQPAAADPEPFSYGCDVE